MDGGAWWTAVHGVTKSQTQLSETKHNTRTTLRASLVAQLVKNLPAMQETVCDTRDVGLIPGSRRSSRQRNGYPLQYSRLENTMERGAYPIVYGDARVRHE